METDDNLAANAQMFIDEDDNSDAVAQANARQLLPHDVKELEIVTNYAAKKEDEMQKMSDDFNQMGKLRLIWDSKVPERNKKFYHRFSLKASNRDEVLAEIKKYKDFYKEITIAIRKVSNSEGKTESERENPYTIILDLNEKLDQLTQAAISGEKGTSSSAIYNIHGAFIQKHEKLENMIKRVECVALKEGMRTATDGWQESIRAIGNLTEDLRNTEARYDQMCERFDRLMFQNDILLDQQRTLLENNKRMENQQEILLQENETVKAMLRAMEKREADKNEKK